MYANQIFLAASAVLLCLLAGSPAAARGEADTVTLLSENHGDGARPAKLVINGMRHGRFSGGDLSFRVAGAPPLHPKASGATIFIPDSGQVVDVAMDWVYDPASNSLTVPAASVARLIAKLPRDKELHMDIGLTSEDGEFGKSWTLPIRIR